VQKGDSQHNLPTTPLKHICASRSRFQPIMRDLESCRKMPGFALSRRQRGFESRWGHKIKPPLTRSNASYFCGRRQVRHGLRELQGAGTSAGAVKGARLLTRLAQRDSRCTDPAADALNCLICG
jgi:hypothetical protein